MGVSAKVMIRYPMRMSQPSVSTKLPWYGWVPLMAALPVLFVLMGGLLAAKGIARISVYGLLAILWWPRGRRALYVYSDSPVWKEHIESTVLHCLSDRVAVLNWSRRKRWRWSLAALLFRHFGGSKEFNPMAIVFPPFRKRVEFRFYRPFQDWKKGRTEGLERMERRFLALLSGMGLTK